jgi:hypothetical protein
MFDVPSLYRGCASGGDKKTAVQSCRGDVPLGHCRGGGVAALGVEEAAGFDLGGCVREGCLSQITVMLWDYGC